MGIQMPEKTIFFNDHPDAPTAPSILHTNTSELRNIALSESLLKNLSRKWNWNFNRYMTDNKQFNR